MKRLFGVLSLVLMLPFISSALAGEDVPAAGTTVPRFNPTLRVGCAFDAAETHYVFDAKRSDLSDVTKIDLNRAPHARLYLAAELPFALTDRLALAVDGEWSFSRTEKQLGLSGNNGVFALYWDPDDTAHWVTADLLVSYALVRDAGVIKDLSVIAGARWDYQTMGFTNPHDVRGFISRPTDTIDFRMQTLAPVFGLGCTLTGIKSDIWGGDVNLLFLAGPIVWGSEDYAETFANIETIRFHDTFHHGYMIKAYADVTVLSGKITPSMEASLSIFGQYTRIDAKGDVEGTITGGAPNRSPFAFEMKSDVGVIGIDASLAF